MAGSSLHYDNRNAKELQRVESLAKIIRTLLLLAGDLDLIEKGELGPLKKTSQKSKEC
jgi:hypothetical protein